MGNLCDTSDYYHPFKNSDEINCLEKIFDHLVRYLSWLLTSIEFLITYQYSTSISNYNLVAIRYY